jgi:drug/metabolite transporter (DMT)-like permease
VGTVEKEAKRARLLVLVAFGCVYFFWGSTFVAIRYVVRFISPAFTSGLRYAIAGSLLMAILAVRGKSVRVSRAELVRLLVIGLMLLTGNNVLLAWGEQYVSSGMASLIMASIPILIALMETVVPGGEPLNRVGWVGTMLGVGGMVLLLWPSLHLPSGENGGVLLACGILMLGGVSWAVGSVVARRWTSSADPMVASAWQMLMGGATNIGIGSALGGWHTAHWTRGVAFGLLWLAIFGSLIGYSAYTYLLHHVPVAKVATYAYVNPIVAVLLGAVFLGERLRGLEWVGMGVILLAVATVTASKAKARVAAGEIVTARRA